MKLHLACVIVSLGLAGCSACHKHPCCGPNTGPPPPPVTNAYLLPAHPLTPCDSCPAPNVALTPPNGLPPTVPPYRRMPDDSRVRLAIPEPSPAESARQGVRLFPPRVADSATGVQPAVAAEERGGTPSLPAIYQFAVVKDNLASGLKPTQEGVDWLNAKGYRAVLYLRPPGKEDSADRKLIEGTGGLKYLPLEVSPETLKDVVDQFNKIVDNSANRPLFVYDNDGTLTGVLWYIYFRLVDNLPDEKARLEAGRLGLKEDGAAEQVTMWIAVQKYLRDRGK